MRNIERLHITMNLLKLKNRREIISWSLYDFANQPFTTIIVTFIYSAFFVKVIAYNEQIGTTMWANAIAITAVYDAPLPVNSPRAVFKSVVSAQELPLYFKIYQTKSR